MISQLESMSGIDGDNIREMTNVLLTFGNVTGETFDKGQQSWRSTCRWRSTRICSRLR